MEYADEKSISDNLAMLGLAYMRQSKYDEALHYMRRCYQLDSACLIESSTGNRYKMAVRLTQKASILLALNRLPSAQEPIHFFKQSVPPNTGERFYNVKIPINRYCVCRKKAVILHRKIFKRNTEY